MPDMFENSCDWWSPLCKKMVRQYLCKLHAVSLLFCRGDDFCITFKQLGELRPIVPANVTMMALTATATRPLWYDICCILGMINPYVVEVSPNKPNVFLAYNSFSSIMEILGPIAERLKVHRTNLGRIIIFCKKRDLCSQIYSFFLYFLRDQFTVIFHSYYMYNVYVYFTWTMLL